MYIVYSQISYFHLTKHIALILIIACIKNIFLNIVVESFRVNLSLVSDCAEMVRSHYRFSYVASEDRLTAASLKDCSSKCSRETYCNTFSFR